MIIHCVGDLFVVKKYFYDNSPNGKRPQVPIGSTCLLLNEVHFEDRVCYPHLSRMFCSDGKRIIVITSSMLNDGWMEEI